MPAQGDLPWSNTQCASSVPGRPACQPPSNGPGRRDSLDFGCEPKIKRAITISTTISAFHTRTIAGLGNASKRPASARPTRFTAPVWSAKRSWSAHDRRRRFFLRDDKGELPGPGRIIAAGVTRVRLGLTISPTTRARSSFCVRGDGFCFRGRAVVVVGVGQLSPTRRWN
jgi:thioredoxin reductase